MSDTGCDEGGLNGFVADLLLDIAHVVPDGLLHILKLVLRHGTVLICQVFHLPAQILNRIRSLPGRLLGAAQRAQAH